MFYRIFTALSLIVILSGCASTTHLLTVNPILELPTASLVNLHKIEVKTNSLVDDNIGSIDTAIKEHADLVLANNLEERINTKVIKGLESLGLKPTQGNEPAIQILIEITQLDYTSEAKAINTTATLKFSMKATVKAKGQVYKGNYSSEATEKFTTLPSQISLEESLSKITGQTVGRLLNDQNIRILLQK